MTGNVTGGRDGDAATPAPADRPAAASVRLLEPRDVPVAARVLALAFADEPAKHALFGDAATSSSPFANANTRTRFTEAVAGGRLRGAARYAGVHVAEIDGAIAGVAMWYPPGAQPGAVPISAALALFTPGTRVLSLIARVGGLLWQDRDALKRLVAGRTAAAKQAGRGPCWYLAVLGTDPGHRGRGVARLLLERTLDRCDVEGLPAWLETTEATTAGMYERFGFHTIAAIEGGLVLPGLWVMRREPRVPRRAQERRATPGAPG